MNHAFKPLENAGGVSPACFKAHRALFSLSARKLPSLASTFHLPAIVTGRKNFALLSCSQTRSLFLHLALPQSEQAVLVNSWPDRGVQTTPLDAAITF